MKNNYWFKVLIIFLVLSFFCFPLHLVKADDYDDEEEIKKPPTLQNITSGLEYAGGEQGMGINTATLGDPGAIQLSIGVFINIVISLVGIIAVFFLVYAGWLWITAQGNEEQITKAKKITKNCIIAIIVVLSAWTIYSALFYLLAL